MISPQRYWIQNGNIITSHGLEQGCLLIEKGIIAGIYPVSHSIDEQEAVVDAEGCYVMPGLIDMHSDAIEKELQPRPGTYFPPHMSYFELEKKLAACGVTTIYHSLSLADGVGVREDEQIVAVINEITRLNLERSMIRHRIHLRYEITNLDGLEMVKHLIRSNQIQILSFMDHTPGQGQFTLPDSYESYLIKTYGIRGEELQLMVDKLQRNAKLVDWEQLQQLAEEAIMNGVILASHDDDDLDKIDLLAGLGFKISEFPIHLKAAEYAWEKDMSVCVGSPNIVRGQSHSKNMRAIDAITSGYANMICSDYLPSSLLTAIFQLNAVDKIPLHQAVAMITANPASALGIFDQVGSIESGKQADLLLVELYNGYPLVRQTIVNGQAVYTAMPYFSQNKEDAVYV